MGFINQLITGGPHLVAWQILDNLPRNESWWICVYPHLSQKLKLRQTTQSSHMFDCWILTILMHHIWYCWYMTLWEWKGIPWTLSGETWWNPQFLLLSPYCRPIFTSSILLFFMVNHGKSIISYFFGLGWYYPMTFPWIYKITIESYEQVRFYSRYLSWLTSRKNHHEFAWRNPTNDQLLVGGAITYHCG